MGAEFGRSPKRFVIDVHDAKALGISFGPFVIVQQRPQEVAPNVVSLLDGTMQRDQMVSQIFTTAEVMNLPARLDLIRIGRTVLGNVNVDTPYTSRACRIAQ